MLTENDLAKLVVDAAFRIHLELGPGLLESVYESILAHELVKLGLMVERQKSVPIRFEGLEFQEGFRADLIVNGKLILELKSVENLTPLHAKQLRTYLRLSGMKLGLLINFNTVLIKNGIKRVANGVDESEPV